MYGQCNVPAPNTEFVAIAAGDYHSLGLKADGTIVAWGYNNEGQCDVPSSNMAFVAVATGNVHSLGLKADGSIVAWGGNWAGQCNVPAPNTDFVAVAAGQSHSLGLKADGSIVAWGYDNECQCNVPAPNTDFVAVAGGSDHSLGLKSDGSIAAWGANYQGQCNVPAPNTDFVALAAGWFHSLGLKADGSIVAWGSNSYGQCNVPLPNSDFVAVTSGGWHSLGLKATSPDCPGDLDCDGDIDFDDIDPFVLALQSHAAYVAQYPDCEWLNADCNHDGYVDFDDIDPFVAILSGGPYTPNMVLIPGGSFDMGDPWNEGNTDERPVHNVYLSPYHIDTHEVTNQQYCDGLNWAYDQGGMIHVSDGVVYQYGGTTYSYCDTHSIDTDSRIHFSDDTFTVTPGKEDHPMVEVNWYGSVAYCNWRSAMEGKPQCYNLSTWTCDFGVAGCRLPTEAEWEKAAAWDPAQQRHFRFGEQTDGCGYDCLSVQRANYWDSGDPLESGQYPYTTPVGYYDGSQYGEFSTQDAQSYYGCYDMSGNVFEWCNDWYSDSYYAAAPGSNPMGPDSGTDRVLRGGSWAHGAHFCRTAVRAWSPPAGRGYSGGFRCALGTP